MNLEPRQADDTPLPRTPKATPPAENPTPHPRLRLHRGFQSIYLPDKRDIIVYLPPGYDKAPDRIYPVLYLQDGQNLFDPRTSFIPGNTWQVREQADAAIRAGEVEPLIVVGIYNTPARMAEYTHEHTARFGGGPKQPNTGSRSHARFCPSLLRSTASARTATRPASAAARWAGWSRSIWDCAMRRFLASWPS